MKVFSTFVALALSLTPIVSNAQTKVVSQMKAAKDYTPAKEEEAKKIFEELSTKIRNYRATSPDDLVNFTERELDALEATYQAKAKQL